MDDLNLEISLDTDNQETTRKLGIEDFAKEVNVSYQTIHRYIKQGKLVPRRTLGGKAYFLTPDVDAYLKHYSSEPLILDGAPTYGTAE